MTTTTKTLTPTDEQLSIINAAQNTNDNLLIIALAGSAKTTTLEMVAHSLSDQYRSLCLSFNRIIADEMGRRLPSNCKSLTLNSIGHRIWGRYLGQYNTTLKLERNKLWNILKNINQGISYDQRLYGSEAREVIETVKLGKTIGFLPVDTVDSGITPACDYTQLLKAVGYYLSPIQEKFIIEISKESFYQSCQGIIDYDDQILCPTIVDDVQFPKFDVIYVDESQDLSNLNHKMLDKIVQDKRLIAVGDPKQAIYGFRGADLNSMASMSKRFNMSEYRLTISFRCARKIVENVHWHAPEMKYCDAAPDGEVVVYDAWSSKDIPDGAAVLCRNNAPLFPIFIKLLSEERYPELADKSIIDKIIKIMKDLGGSAMKQDIALEKIAIWLGESLSRLNEDEDKAQYYDLYECMTFIMQQSDTLGDAMKRTEQIKYNQNGSILLSTIHKAKGTEYDTVFMLDSHLLHNYNEYNNGSIKANRTQDDNLRYVGETRAKVFLGYINSDNFVHSIK